RACSLWDGMRLSLDALREVVPEIGEVAAERADEAGAGSGMAAGAQAGPAAIMAAQAFALPHGAPGHGAAERGAVGATQTLPEQIAALERTAIARALQEADGNRTRAARRLGIARATLYQKLLDYPELSDFRTEMGDEAESAANRLN
uniref:helix-turn-helix domain-containing protein n=1 Tax=Dongia sp. TaxID=1977262 RepID=UPI0035B1B490